METIISASLYNEILMRHGSIHTPFDLGYCSNHVLQLTSCSPPLIMLHYARQVFTALFLIHASEILIFFFLLFTICLICWFATDSPSFTQPMVYQLCAFTKPQEPSVLTDACCLINPRRHHSSFKTKNVTSDTILNLKLFTTTALLYEIQMFC